MQWYISILLYYQTLQHATCKCRADLNNKWCLCSYLTALSTLSRLFMGSSADTPSPTDSCPSSLIQWWKWSWEQVTVTLPSEALSLSSLIKNFNQKPLSLFIAKKICGLFILSSPGHAECWPVPSSHFVGAVKVTPAHDHTDFLLSQRHSLPRITVIGGDGTMTHPCGEWLKVHKHHYL